MEYKVIDRAWEDLYQRLEEDGLIPKELKKERIKKVREYLYRYLSAAAIVIICVFAGWRMLKNNDTGMLLVLHNEAGTPTLVKVLDDGSVVYLAEKSSLHYPATFTGGKREVMLQGNAFFDIKNNPSQSFFILTEQAKVEVTGTSFRIESGVGASFQLSVYKGEVKVTQIRKNESQTVRIGEKIIFNSGGIQVEKAENEYPGDFFNRIHFRDENLENVAHVINLHSDSVRLEIDPAVANRLLTFTLTDKTLKTANIAELISRALNLQYSRQGNVIYITKKN
jgi:ferric-dicitrate binding protein FerR (iron transport regulator)